MTTVCAQDMCTGCMACVDICHQGAINIVDSLSAYNAVIDPGICTDCGMCKHVCPQVNPPKTSEPVAWFQGWAVVLAIREASSSGGFAAAIERAFVARGGIVCSCVQQGKDFIFDLSNDTAGIERMRGSKYVKSDPSGAYRQMKDELRRGRDVLFVGLPCQVAAVRNYVGDFAKRLYTVDLICHGTPSPQLLERYLSELNIGFEDGSKLCFRKKNRFQLYTSEAKTGFSYGAQDRYTIAFLAGLVYTENCYSCRYACPQRVSDLTLGDSWGTELADELPRGVSLALCQTDKGKELLAGADLVLLPVDEAHAREHNGQLVGPADRPRTRKSFFSGLDGRGCFEKLVFHALPKQCAKQLIKGVLISIGLLRR